MLRRSSRTFRLIAGGCLLAFFCTQWASTAHVHSHSHWADSKSAAVGDTLDRAIGAADFTLSSDDAHEEHSALIENAEANCAFCRSNGQKEHARPTRFEVGFGASPPRLAHVEPAEERASAMFARLRPSRAPPIRRFA